MLSEQGVRPGSINMGRILRQLAHHSNQSRKVTYHRPTIFGKDNYGVEGGSVVTPELLYPKLPALIRPALTADYNLERAGVNVIGAARVYTPNIQTIKNFPNFDQTVINPNFDEIEGWDRFIDTERTIYQVPTAATTSWVSGSADVTFTSDGETLTATLGSDYDGTFHFSTTAKNTLSADRLSMQVKATGVVKLSNFKVYNGTSLNGAYSTGYTPASMTIPTDDWLTIDVPYITGTVASGTSIYQSGTRYATTVASGASFDYEGNFRDFQLEVSGSASGNKLELRAIKLYKSISWHVHSLKELNTDYMIFNCVRTSGRRDSIRRAY